MNEFDQTQEKTSGTTGVPQESDEGRDSAPTQQPVDAPRHEHDDFDGVDVDAKEGSADFDAEETNAKE